MNPDFLKLWNKAQEAWLENCINFYGRILNGTEEFLKMNKAYHEKMQETVKAKKNEGK